MFTWASASSLRALTRESSFSFSKAHWEKTETIRDIGHVRVPTNAKVWLVLPFIR